MSTPRPAWRKAFDSVERTVAGPLERTAENKEFVALLTVVGRLRRTAGRATDGTAAWMLHQAGLPAWRDVRRLSSGVARLERRVRDLSHQLDEMQRSERSP